MEESGTYYLDKGEADISFENVISRAQRVIERVPEFQDPFGKTGQRIVLAKPDGPDGPGGVTIVWYDGHENVRTIDAATEELALEFEQYIFDDAAASKH